MPGQTALLTPMCTHGEQYKPAGSAASRSNAASAASAVAMPGAGPTRARVFCSGRPASGPDTAGRVGGPSGRGRSEPFSPPALSLRGTCDCGAVGYEATGPSSLNFVCHCSVCRAATGRPATAAAAFKPEQVELVNVEGMEVRTPPGSRNARYYCGSCSGYVAEDATRVLGVFALPLAAAAAGGPLEAVPAHYQPNHHMFYADRAADVNDQDDLPKWKTLPQGTLLDNAGDVVEPSARLGVRVGAGDSVGGDAPSRGGADALLASVSVSVSRDPATGRYRKDVLPLSPPRPPYAGEYVFTESDPIPNHSTVVSPAKQAERTARKYEASPRPITPEAARRITHPSAAAAAAAAAPSGTGGAERVRDVVIVGGGHNGMVAAAYLAKAGLDVLVLERRGVVGGACVTEEIVPGFKFSRGAYLAGLMRPGVIEDLGLKDRGFKYLPRDPTSFTPSTLEGPNKGRYLMLGSDDAKNAASIAQFSARDAEAYPRYEEFLHRVRSVVTPLLDAPMPDPTQGALRERLQAMATIKELVCVGYANREVLVPFYELFTAPASHILDRWFESEMLKTTLATDAVIGALTSPTQAGSGYVLLHHVMGEVDGRGGSWAYVEGGMGAVSEAIASAARDFGAQIEVSAAVERILHEGGAPGPRAAGVRLVDGTVVPAKTVLAACSPYHAFLELLPGLARDSGYTGEEASPLPPEFQHHIRFADQGCGAFKINVAVDALPNFACCPNDPAAPGMPGPQHMGTVHFENRMEELEYGWREASMGVPATRPIIEMTIPSALDSTIAPPGKHVVQLFVQYAPYDVDPKVGNWADPSFKEAFVARCFRIVDEFCPGFSDSVIGVDALSPLDLERVFGLHKGNIFHGSLSLHQLGYTRPAAGHASHRTPLAGLYLCSAGSHPGGGVQGAAGRNCANIVLSDLGIAG